jgi:hypothetical protein
VLPRAAQGAGGEGDVTRVGAAGEVEQVGEGREVVGLVVELGGVEVQSHGGCAQGRGGGGLHVTLTSRHWPSSQR